MAYDEGLFDAYNMQPAYRLMYPDENVIRFLTAHFPTEVRSEKKILDLGFGSGRHLILLGELGFGGLYGIEGSGVAVRFAKEWLTARTQSAHITHSVMPPLPYEDNFFDGIIEHAVLVNNEWEDILEICKESYRVLKPGGTGFFLLKTKKDCAFDEAEHVGHNTYLVGEDAYISKKGHEGDLAMTFHAFDRTDIRKMFEQFSAVRIHTWDMSFKRLHIDDIPGVRKTSYWIVIVRK